MYFHLRSAEKPYTHQRSPELELSLSLILLIPYICLVTPSLQSPHFHLI